ncbi:MULTISPECIES: glycosyltransferase family 4 protein [Mycobacterium]|uniref:Glycosyltransferase family 4 protein n=1 Tax=Mycobacterium colombiense TaxID=339268 RepID=A0A329MB56_9MYCO|nr:MULTISPECIES: glycosyltransferase family 4 protein [Mycobacterium]MDM4139900.1 glycosyltransferase family 4 protein [Mycobacterium sp. FLAC0960]RAV16868.1 glycosyltransferase family 4 protein [Mycobacterium colombiense]
MTAPLRVALIASTRYPIRQPFAGGLEAHVCHLARALASSGYRVSLFAASGSDPGLKCQMLDVRPLDLSAAARHDVSMPPAAFMADHHAYLSFMLWLAGAGSQEFDVVHNHSLHYLPVAMASTLSTPMLTTVHTPPTPWLESAISAATGRGTRFTAVSRHTAAAWRNVVRDIAVVPNGVDTGQWPLGAGGPKLVWFGRITPEKAPHLAIAAAKVACRPLVLAGPVSDHGYFVDQVEPHLHGDIQYAGHLDHQRLAALVGHSAAALVTPTWDEPYGLVVAEAMSCGTPVVAFARGGIPELISSSSGQLVAAGDVTAMAEAIPGVVQLPRKQVREHAISRCSAESMITAYIDLYRQMIDDSAGRTHDRLLHSPPRIRPSGAGHEHLRPDAPPNDGDDVAGNPGSTPLCGRREVTAR